MFNSGDIFTKSLLDYIHTVFIKKEEELQAGGWLSYGIMNKFKA